MKKTQTAATVPSSKSFPSFAELVNNKAPLDLGAWLAHTTSRNKRSAQLNELDSHVPEKVAQRLGHEQVSLLLKSVHPDAAGRFGAHLDQATFVSVLRPLSAYFTADVLRELSPTKRAATLAGFDPAARQDLEELLRWDPSSAGGNMTPSFLVLPGAMSTAAAIEQLRETAKDIEAATYIYLVDDDGRLMGALSFRGLVTAATDGVLADHARDVLQTVEPTVDQEVAANILNDYDLTALPVTLDGRPLGVITADRAAEIIDLETTEDFRRISSTGGLTTSLKDASVWLLYRSRIGWLVILVFGNLFSGAGIAHYEDLIEKAVVLVFFLPLLIDSGGNAGSQASTLMVRGLATGDVYLRDWLKMLAKEFSVAVLLGITMALAVSIVGFMRGGPLVALVVSLTMILIVLVGCLVGMSLPFLLSRLNLDPANASTPLVTTICDGLGVLIYFFIASQLLL